MDNKLIVSEQFGLSEGLTLEDCEHDIEIANQFEELSHFVKGKRLAQIRDKNWYKTYGSFDDYCRQRWQMSGSNASRLIAIADTIENLKRSNMFEFLPQTQRQAMPLIGLEPEKQVEVWEEAVKTAPTNGVPGISVTHDKKISGRYVQEIVDRLYPTDSTQEREQNSIESINSVSEDFKKGNHQSEIDSTELQQHDFVSQEPYANWTASELKRKDAVSNGKTVIANKKTDQALIKWSKENDIYVAIDRGTIWGNPFVLPDDGSRQDVIEKYSWYYDLKPSLQNKIENLRGKVLGCWCYPEACHGGVLKGKVDVS